MSEGANSRGRVWKMVGIGGSTNVSRVLKCKQAIDASVTMRSVPLWGPFYTIIFAGNLSNGTKGCQIRQTALRDTRSLFTLIDLSSFRMFQAIRTQIKTVLNFRCRRSIKIEFKLRVGVFTLKEIFNMSFNWMSNVSV